MEPAITSDNPNLSKVKIDLFGPEQNIAISCNPSAEQVEVYLRAGHSASTKRAYRADLAHYQQQGGVFPATPEALAHYLAHQASLLSPHTLQRRLAAISKAHEAAGLDNPCKTALVRATLRGIRRLHGTQQRQVKPLLREDLLEIVDGLAEDPKGIRDKALLLVGFAGAFRRSELVGIRVEDVRFVSEGMVIRLPKSKTDQTGQGRDIGIPRGRSRACPVKALIAWLEHSGINSGPIFRALTKGGTVGKASLSSQAVASVVKLHAERVGLDSREFAGHSLRAGLITSAAKLGVSTYKIRQQSGHASEAMLGRYIRDGELFINNAAAIL